jgi:hypothetical protein
MNNSLSNSKMTPEKLLKLFNGEAKGMSNEEAAKLLLFLKKLARIVVIKYLGR